MILCEEGHDEICFEAKVCPLCKLRAEAYDEIEDLKNQIKEWKKSESI